MYGLISPSWQTAYSASKFAVRGFSNSLRHELAGSKVGVTVVHPGGVATSIADNARVSKDMPPKEVARRKAIAKKALRMPPATAGEIIVKGIERRSPRVLVGNDAKFRIPRTPGADFVLENLQPVGSQVVMAPYDAHSKEWHFIPSKELCRDKTSMINRQMGLPNNYPL